jgi:signal transduction histidine kinase
VFVSCTPCPPQQTYRRISLNIEKHGGTLWNYGVFTVHSLLCCNLVPQVREKAVQSENRVTSLQGNFVPDAFQSTLNQNKTEIADLFAGADVGLALFDADLRLLACNDLYRTLCGYLGSDLLTGVQLQHLMRTTFSRLNVPAEEIDEKIEKIMARLEPGTAYTFRYTAPSGSMVEIRRRRLPNGTVVETAREIDSPASGLDMNTQYEMIAEQSRSRLMHALDVMADGFALYDANDRIVLYNRKYVDYSPLVGDVIMPGAAKEEILRKSTSRGAFVLNGRSEEEYINWRLERHRNPKEPIEVQLTDGRWLLITEKRTNDGGIVGTRSDITELKQREFEMLRISQQLHARNLQFDTALTNMVQGLCMFSKDQKLVVVNKRYLDIYGFSADVVKPGITLRELMQYSVSLGNYTAEEAERALAERNDPNQLSRRSVIKQRLKDGRVIAVMNEPMSDGGTIATYQDITETEKNAAMMLLHTQKLENSNRELADFAYVASHDLQEPLRKIEAFGERLVNKYANILPDDGKMFVDRMQNAAGRMRKLINDLLSYSRVTTDAKGFQNVSLSKVLTEVMSDLQIRIEETEATIEFAELPVIECEAMQMRQLLQNLLGNALKFRKPGVLPVINVSAEILQTSEDHVDIPHVRLTIADNGIGFDNQFKDQIFTIFQRLHSRTEYEGTGIGLATVRKIVERHGGTINAYGESGIGAKFFVTLPLLQGSKDQTT